MTVVMPPRRAPTQGFHNKPYFPDLTVRRSSRLASDATPVRVSPRRSSSTSQTPPAKRRRSPADTKPHRNAPTAPKTLERSKFHLEVTPSNAVASSSKRKADSSLTEDETLGESSAFIMSRRKKRKENAVVEKMTTPADCQMRAILRNKPRARSSTNKYGTRSAASIESSDIANVDPSRTSLPPTSNDDPLPKLTARQSSPPRPPQVTIEITNEDSFPIPSSTPEPMVTEDTPPETISIEPSQQDTEMYTPEPVSRSSYVTYTDLTPYSSDAQFSAPLPSTFTPSILSELHDDFGFPSDPDLDPRALLNSSEVAFPQPLQDQMSSVSSCDSRSADASQWSREARQKEMEEMRRQKLANQRRDRLWTNLTDQKYKEFVKNHGIDEVRARVKADTQKAAAREAEARTVQGLNHTSRPVVSSQPATAAEPNSIPAIRPSFEMYSPEADEGEVDEKSDADGDDEDDDDDDDDGSIVDDIPPDTNFDLPPPLMVSPLKANPLGGGVTVFGTPPFLERRQAWGGDKLLSLSMKHSIELQQPRPARSNFPVPPPGAKLPPPSSFPVPSSISSRPPPPPPPSPPVSYQETPNPHPTPDFSSDPTESYADPTIMQAIIASMNPSSIDFNFGNAVNWADDMGLLPGVNSVDMESWQSSSFDSSFPRSSQVLSTSSSTLHSALG